MEKKVKNAKKTREKVPPPPLPPPPPPPPRCIHVRARRGEATDPHSLAERARRERISERMKQLQSLVPACHKVMGKVVVLDEIINYVQSLQSQIQFLSTKIASLTPIMYDFMDLEYSFLINPCADDEIIRLPPFTSDDLQQYYSYNTHISHIG